MKKIICKKEYNTENATIIKKVTFSYFGDPAGYEQTLCQTPDGLYFVYVCKLQFVFSDYEVYQTFLNII